MIDIDMRDEKLERLERTLQKIRADVRVRVWVESKWRQIKGWAKRWRLG